MFFSIYMCVCNFKFLFVILLSIHWERRSSQGVHHLMMSDRLTNFDVNPCDFTFVGGGNFTPNFSNFIKNEYHFRIRFSDPFDLSRLCETSVLDWDVDRIIDPVVQLVLSSLRHLVLIFRIFNFKVFLPSFFLLVVLVVSLSFNKVYFTRTFSLDFY